MVEPVNKSLTKQTKVLQRVIRYNSDPFKSISLSLRAGTVHRGSEHTAPTDSGKVVNGQR